MDDIRNYFIVRSGSLDDLRDLVRDMIKKGWQPQGGIAVVGVGPDRLVEYLQVMVLV